ncbi:hypothetical protein D3C80_848820 [compost metagenome]
MALVITHDCLAKLGNALRPRIEGLTRDKRIRRRLGDEIRRRQITLADPERHQVLASPGIGDDFANAAARCRRGAGADIRSDEIHGGRLDLKKIKLQGARTKRVDCGRQRAESERHVKILRAAPVCCAASPEAGSSR